MALSYTNCGSVILAGGLSRRMGTCKALLRWNSTTIIHHIAQQLHNFDEILLSANDKTVGTALGISCIPDIYPDAGPLSGLYSALSATQKTHLFSVPCDLPFFQDMLPTFLLQHMEPDVQVLICRDGTGRLHPLCGIYSTSVLPILREQLEKGEYKVCHFLDRVSIQILDTGGILPDHIYYNINTPEAYQKANIMMQAIWAGKADNSIF